MLPLHADNINHNTNNTKRLRTTRISALREMNKTVSQSFARACLMAVLLLVSGMHAWAEEGVILSLKNGSEIGFAFSSKPRLTMGTELTFTSSDGVSVSYAYAEVKNVRFGEFSVTGIEDVETVAQTPDVSFRISAGTLMVSGLPVGENVRVYDLSGHLVAMQEQTADGAVLSVLVPARGVLVVRTSNGISYRILNP